ncbi:hypothetical protein LWI28_008773 [Acer negundo]|uniref:C2 domain-containing protein n=1 Tax=Acer negundo TaxID=4023 RepID=A0AAD5ILR1_ACENE|nr:hypothetical protein LWI28_008773 [Acer negundo]KAK4842275.1 hypothetical protein QYF36_018946 [Acer negundo]
MEGMLGLLKIRVKRGINLAVRDSMGSDPYVVINYGTQKLKTRFVKRNCNPEWNEELTLSIQDPNIPITLTVFDKDTFTVDDKMGQAEIDIKPYIEAMQMELENLPNGCAVKKVEPSRKNCLADESIVEWNEGKMSQDMRLRLKNVECGEVEISIQWIDIPGFKGLKSATIF